MDIRELIALIVVVGLVILRLLAMLWPSGRGEKPREPAPRRTPEPGSEQEEDPFEELRRRIEEAARRRRDEEVRRTGSPAPRQQPAPPRQAPPPQQPARPEPTYQRPQPQPIPQPAPQPQPEYRRPVSAKATQATQSAKIARMQVEQLPSARLEPKAAMVAARGEAKPKAAPTALPPGFTRIEQLPPLQRALVLAEVLGPAPGLSPLASHTPLFSRVPPESSP